MRNTGRELSLEEIRKGQAEIAFEMGKSGLAPNEQVSLEQASIHLRNLERMLVASIGKELVADLKNETLALHALTEEINRTSQRLSKLSKILSDVVKITGQLIDILVLVK